MQSSEVRILVSAKRLPWESSELIALKMIRDRLYSFYSLTEGNLDNMSKMMILKELKSLSTYTEDLIRFVTKEIDYLIERYSKGNKVCNFC